MCYKPDDPIEYLESCLQKVKELGGSEKVKWDTFVSPEKKTLPPLNGGQSRRSFFRNVMPDNSNFPYRRYDRLPPIQQFSIESDTDLSETAELIEEYDVFDPARPRPKIILVIGGPGSGKGTQSLKIAERYGFNYISVGELLRKKIHSTSSNRKWSLIAKIITTGELAPQETTITEIKQRLMQIPDEEGIVIDGFPRDVAQAISFEDQICTPDLVVFLACSNQRLKERLLKRAEQQGRPDDNLKATQRRLMNFKQNAVPLVKYFQEKGLIVTFDADRDEEEVFSDISSAVDNKLFANKEAAQNLCPIQISPQLRVNLFTLGNFIQSSYHPTFLQAHFSGLSIASYTTIPLIKKLCMLIDSNCQIHLFELQMISQCDLKALKFNDRTSSLKIGTSLETVCKHKTAELFLFFSCLFKVYCYYYYYYLCLLRLEHLQRKSLWGTKNWKKRQEETAAEKSKH
uniref:Adenylate kinase isoenzyme 5 n=1 Tax=Meleagris gallopavo TaxID=9103 RepID=G1NBE0_MELGA